MKSVQCIITYWMSKVILKVCNPEIKGSYRNYERLALKLINERCHLEFNLSCIQHNLLPVYTNIKLHDKAARPQDFVIDFRKKLIERQISQQKQNINTLNEQVTASASHLQQLVDSPIRFSALELLLDRNVAARKSEQKAKHIRKLCNMYGSTVLQKEYKEPCINLSSIAIDEEIKEIMALGMNCHLKQKYDSTQKKIEIEKLYSNIVQLEREGKNFNRGQ